MNRRKVLLASGVTLSTALAGCSDDTDLENGSDNGDENGSANGNENGNEEGGDDAELAENGDESSISDDGNGNEDSNGDDNSDATDDKEGNDDESENSDTVFEIESGTTIKLEARTTEWIGLTPTEINWESNPTLILQAGEPYAIGWTQGDGHGHNIAIWDDNNEVVNSLETELTDEENPNDQILEFTASEEMAQYVCLPHAQMMTGELKVKGGNAD